MDCDKLREKYPELENTECCNSCHGEIDDFGLDYACEIKIAGKWFFTCCNVAEVFDNMNKLEAKLFT